MHDQTEVVFAKNCPCEGWANVRNETGDSKSHPRTFRRRFPESVPIELPEPLKFDGLNVIIGKCDINGSWQRIFSVKVFRRGIGSGGVPRNGNSGKTAAGEGVAI